MTRAHAILIAALIGVASTGCGDSESSTTPATTAAGAAEEADAEPTPTDGTVATTSPATTEAPATTGVPRDVAVDDVAFTDPRITDPASAVCAAHDELAATGSAAVTAALAPDAVVVDASSGDVHSGQDAIASYADELVEAGLQGAGCIHLLQSDRWVAQTIVLQFDDGDVQQGIMAVHVDPDGVVDQQINHLSERTDTPGERVDPEVGTDAVAAQVCEAWAGDDLDRMVDLMSPDVVVHTARDFEGASAVRQFAEGLPYDLHTCGVPIQNAEWEAIESIMTDPANDRERSMLAVLHLEATAPAPVVDELWFHFDG